MKALFALALATCVLTASTVQAARVAVTTNGNIASVYLKAAKGDDFGGDLNGDFDSVLFTFTPAAGVTLTNPASGAGRPAGDPFTYRNRVLDADPLDGGLGWSILGQTISANIATWGGGPLGSTISTGDAASAGLFLQNLQFSVPATKTVGTGNLQLLSAGNIIADIPVVIPEPTSVMLTASALIGLLGLRRRSA